MLDFIRRLLLLICRLLGGCKPEPEPDPNPGPEPDPDPDPEPDPEPDPDPDPDPEPPHTGAHLLTESGEHFENEDGGRQVLE